MTSLLVWSARSLGMDPDSRLALKLVSTPGLRLFGQGNKGNAATTNTAQRGGMQEMGYGEEGGREGTEQNRRCGAVRSSAPGSATCRGLSNVQALQINPQAHCTGDAALQLVAVHLKHAARRPHRHTRKQANTRVGRANTPSGWGEVAARSRWPAHVPDARPVADGVWDGANETVVAGSKQPVWRSRAECKAVGSNVPSVRSSQVPCHNNNNNNNNNSNNSNNSNNNNSVATHGD